ncbi:hypothetical protein VIOR3934_08386 [Vibrio orientalis CIP 102891 = ATCC 33934]|uniref:Uncharacterized protein n=1 Tax=Vibrio orientalis CIP 102891 = ATCC 33934 TaxID=675816 RepID=C9QFM2_VIBOR|nr:hypothetical protein [Vibrio orientalis]EEX94058.1 hypothetical protein VIA_001216 [Vibrio orientalis CIP 102891 = ATCC 33934]EGU52798.1 hypothetical protein VIOR3934_08386 [Vibrio orientalis CIP 102891 = ATCC 33934]
MDKPLSLYCVSNWYDYALVEAESPYAAVQARYGREYRPLKSDSVTQDCVVHAMCCEYRGYVETILERFRLDIDRVLWLDWYEDTLRFQLISKSEPNC